MFGLGDHEMNIFLNFEKVKLITSEQPISAIAKDNLRFWPPDK